MPERGAGAAVLALANRVARLPRVRRDVEDGHVLGPVLVKVAAFDHLSAQRRADGDIARRREVKSAKEISRRD
jgi:hypothetical protein